MSNVVDLLESLKSITLVPLIIILFYYLVTIVIENYDVTNIEIRLMTPTKRFLIPLSYFTLISIGVSLVLIIFNISAFKQAYDKDSFLNLNFGWTLLLSGVLISIGILLFCIIIFSTSMVLASLIAIRYDYYFDENWKVLRVNNEKVLVAERCGTTQFITDPYTKQYNSSISSNKRKLDFYKSEKYLCWVYLILSVVTIVSCILSILLITKDIYLMGFYLF